MYLIGLTGGIASGKSVVSARLAEHGAVVVDADKLAREVVEPGEPALEKIAEEFGPTVIGADGGLDRAALGAIVFADADKRRALEEITHPAIRERVNERIAEAASKDPNAVVVYDVPLLVEAKRASDQRFDLIVVTDAPASERIDRLVRLRGMTPAEAWRRISAQASDAERLAIADLVIDTNWSLEETYAQVDQLWASASDSAGGKQRQ